MIVKDADMLLNDLAKRYPVLVPAIGDISGAFNLLCSCYKAGGKLFAAGNGGSMADSQHIVGELMKRFVQKRPLEDHFLQSLKSYGEDGGYLSDMLEGALPAISLDAAPLTSAIANDSGCGDTAFSQMVYGLGRQGDVFWGISTSGNAHNVYLAAITAKAKNMRVLGMTGRSGGKLKSVSDVCICVPEDETYKVQELHLPIYHTLCLMLEHEFFGKLSITKEGGVNA